MAPSCRLPRTHGTREPRSRRRAMSTARRLKHAFGAVVRECRGEKGFSQERLAFDAGLTRNFISLIELGKRSPTLDTVERLAKALDTSASALIVRAERKLR